jgi:hypothetical protein
MSEVSDRPLSAQLSQGWEVSHYSTTQDASGVLMHCFLLRKGGRAKLLSVRAKMMGEGFVSVEKEI